METREILSRLQNVKQTGADKWQASCPCSSRHQNGDEHQSLSISIGSSGKTLLYCHTGCHVPEICEAIGITTKDLFPDSPETYQTATQAAVDYYTQKKGLRYVEAYNYCYGSFRDGMTKIRFLDAAGEKDFRWIHENPAKPGGWKAGQDGCRHRLFVSGNINEDIIIITEGEKDAITAHRIMNITAASAENGATKGNAAGAKWRQEYNEQLKGKTVYILHDNDDAGRNFARIEADSIKQVAAAVYILDIAAIWTDCPEKGDISDMAAALGDEKCYEILIDLTAEAKPIPKDREEAAEQGLIQDPLTAFLEKIQSEAYRPRQTGLAFFDDLLGGGIVQQSLIMLMAAPGVGKTTLCQQIAEEMAARQQAVIYFNLEMSREQMLAKAISYRLAKKRQQYKTTLQILQGYNWQQDERQQITAAVEEYRRTAYPYIKYNPDDIGNGLEQILEYLEQVGAAARTEGKQAPAVILDYLHLLGSREKADIQELIKRAVFGLKHYAKEYNTFVIAIIAANRDSNKNGRLTINSGRDSSNLEYTGDYVLGLNYYDIEKGEKNADNPEEMAELQGENYRRLLLRVLKGRLSAPGKSSNIYFDAAHNIFYGANDWIPADATRTPFKDETAADKKKDSTRY